jgi:hypothetical protein
VVYVDRVCVRVFGLYELFWPAGQPGNGVCAHRRRVGMGEHIDCGDLPICDSVCPMNVCAIGNPIHLL